MTDVSQLSRLFVYGSLQPGRENERILQAIGGTFTRAVVKGQLIQSGWGAPLGFPGLILDDTAPTVPGYLFESESLSDHWPKLDAFEGDEYRRVTCTATLPDGTTIDAFIYTLRNDGKTP